MTPLGTLQGGRDIEGLAMHPTNKDVIYGSSSYHAEVNGERLNGYLYTIDRKSGELTIVGASGFGEVSGLAVNPFGVGQEMKIKAMNGRELFRLIQKPVLALR